VRRCQPDLLVKDLGALCDAHLADNRSGLGGYNPDVPVVAAANGTRDVAEPRRIIHHPATITSLVHARCPWHVRAPDQAVFGFSAVD
jgi:hypothetical protein